jgi:hypothetical protein
MLFAPASDTLVNIASMFFLNDSGGTRYFASQVLSCRKNLR